MERAVQEVEAHIWTMLIAREGRIGERLELDLPIIFWMVEYAALGISFAIIVAGRPASLE